MSKRIYLVCIILGSFALTALFWNSFIIYPIKVFTVILHELSHGLAAILSGGSMERIEISYQLGGLCYTQGGSRFLILSAGYIGSMIFGCLIILLAARTRFDRYLSMFIGGALIILVVISIRSAFGILSGLLLGGGMILLGRLASEIVNEILLLFLGTTSALYAIIDIKEDLIIRTVPGSDAYEMSKLLPLPPTVWGLIWIVMSVVAVYFVLKIALKNEKQ